MTIGILRQKEVFRSNQLWTIQWEENDTPFRSLKFYTDIYQENIKEFWGTLEKVANMQIIKVCEGMTLNDDWYKYFRDDKTNIRINTQFVINANNVKEIDEKEELIKKISTLILFQKK